MVPQFTMLGLWEMAYPKLLLCGGLLGCIGPQPVFTVGKPRNQQFCFQFSKC